MMKNGVIVMKKSSWGVDAMDRSEQKSPAESSRFTVNLAPGQREALKAIAEHNSASVSYVVRRAIDEFIEKHKDRQLRLSFPELG